jgi:hypothetical protein
MMATASKARVILRCNFGSYSEVLRVFAYDPWDGTALVLLRSSDGAKFLAREDTGSLEAILDDEAHTYADLDSTLRRRAEYVMPPRS